MGFSKKWVGGFLETPPQRPGQGHRLLPPLAQNLISFPAHWTRCVRVVDKAVQNVPHVLVIFLPLDFWALVLLHKLLVPLPPLALHYIWAHPRGRF